MLYRFYEENDMDEMRPEFWDTYEGHVNLIGLRIEYLLTMWRGCYDNFEFIGEEPEMIQVIDDKLGELFEYLWNFLYKHENRLTDQRQGQRC